MSLFCPGRKWLLGALLVGVLSAATDEAEARTVIAAYEPGFYVRFDTDSCDSPSVNAVSLAPLPERYLRDKVGVSVLFHDAIYAVQNLCNLRGNVTFEAAITHEGRTVAELTLTHASATHFLDHITVGRLKYSEHGRAEGVGEEFLAAALEAAVTPWERVGGEIVKFTDVERRYLDYDTRAVQTSRHPTVAFELARLNSKRIAIANERTALERVDFGLEPDRNDCNTDDELSRAADLGNPVAAYVHAACVVSLMVVGEGHDIMSEIKMREDMQGADAVALQLRFENLMFDISKALYGGYLKAFEYARYARGYEEEFEKYFGALGEHGLDYSFDELIASEGHRHGSRKPSYAEIRDGINRDVLSANCSRMGLLLSGESNAALTALFASSVLVRDGWCAANTLGTTVKFRIGNMRKADCSRTGENTFSCDLSYALDCDIDSFDSTEAGNVLICGLVEIQAHPGEIEATRRADGTLRVERFRARGNKKWLAGG